MLNQKTNSDKQISSKKVTYITPKGLSKLEGELENLRTIKRKEIALQLQETMGEAEETEYMIALQEQSFIEGRIHDLEQLLANYQLIDPGHSDGVVRLGNTVVIRENSREIETYTIVGTAEADPRSGFISNESPLGKSLLDSRVGDDVEIEAPGGSIKFRVVAVQ